MKTNVKEYAKRLRDTSPVNCQFKLGDRVTFTNDYGVIFPGNRIIGFADDDSFQGRFIHLDYDCYWFPVSAKALQIEARS